MSATHTRDTCLTDKVQYLPGVGPWRAVQLARLGVETVGDLLEYLPVRHDRHEERTVEDLDEGMIATVVGRVTAVNAHRGRRGRVVSATLTDNTGRCELQWFNADWVQDRISVGMTIRATGKVREHRQKPQLTNPRFIALGQDARPADDSAPAHLECVYPATAGLSSRMIARLIASNLNRMLALVREWYPQKYLEQQSLVSRRVALEAVHRPDDEGDFAPARRRLAYDELLLMQLAVTLSRRHRKAEKASPVLKCNAEVDRRVRRRFPFKLTPAQDRAVAAITSDLAQRRPMNRLLQGDVGCGKTVVALYAALVSVASRWQAVVMAPTELLAEQHYRSIDQYLSGSRVRHALLVGGLGAGQRRATLEEIESGAVDIVIGTHALIQEQVRFARLGLVVVDEQHRFGVRQRATIRSKALAPHYLVMTATPIPRTLAMTVFGDLDVTTIDALPPGRPGIDTQVVGPGRHDVAWSTVRARLKAGEQAFVVYPLVDESDKIQVKAATSECDRLQREVFAGWSVGLLHGRMKTAEREAVMADFVAGGISVLVATTVVEVGIDVPNATCMVIENAERYGLSQLHQLRGRVGRGKRRGHCFLLTESRAMERNERLGVLARSTDGFEIAEEDLRLRGPGEMLGTRQHGLPELRVADLLRDSELLREAQRDAGQIVRDDPLLRRGDHAVLRSMLVSKYGEVIGLADVG